MITGRKPGKSRQPEAETLAMRLSAMLSEKCTTLLDFELSTGITMNTYERLKKNADYCPEMPSFVRLCAYLELEPNEANKLLMMHSYNIRPNIYKEDAVYFNALARCHQGLDVVNAYFEQNGIK